MRTETICRYCAKKFNKEHGNQIYCSANCKELQKAAIQKKLYNIYKDFRLGYIKNYKILETILPDKGKIEKTFYELKISGFNPDCFFGTLRDKEKIWYRIADFRFYIPYTTKNNIPLIEIIHE